MWEVSSDGILFSLPLPLWSLWNCVWLHLLWSASEIISAWRQQKWLKWFFILNTHKNTHVHTHTIKYRLIDISTQHQWIPQTLWKSSAKMWHIYTLPVFPLTSTPPKKKPPPSSSPPLPWAPFSRPHVSGGRLWRQQLDWAACQRCGPLMDVAGLRNNPLCVEHTAWTQPVLLKHIKWPINSQQACCPSLSPILYTPTNKQDTWRWVICATNGPG